MENLSTQIIMDNFQLNSGKEHVNQSKGNIRSIVVAMIGGLVWFEGLRSWF